MRPDFSEAVLEVAKVEKIDALTSAVSASTKLGKIVKPYVEIVNEDVEILVSTLDGDCQKHEDQRSQELDPWAPRAKPG